MGPPTSSLQAQAVLTDLSNGLGHLISINYYIQAQVTNDNIFCMFPNRLNNTSHGIFAEQLALVLLFYFVSFLEHML